MLWSHPLMEVSPPPFVIPCFCFVFSPSSSYGWSYLNNLTTRSYPNFSFTVESECTESSMARTGTLRTPHGDVQVGRVQCACRPIDRRKKPKKRTNVVFCCSDALITRVITRAPLRVTGMPIMRDVTAVLYRQYDWILFYNGVVMEPTVLSW